MHTGPESLRLICFVWVVLYIVIRVIDIYIIDERRGPEYQMHTGPEFLRPICFVLSPLVPSDVYIIDTGRDAENTRADWP